MVLLFLTYSAMGLSHRHEINGIVIVHDHLDPGRHHHDGDEPASQDNDRSEPESEGEGVYLGQASVSFADDLEAGLDVAPPGPAGRCLISSGPNSPRFQELYSRPLRGPPLAS